MIICSIWNHYCQVVGTVLVKVIMNNRYLQKVEKYMLNFCTHDVHLPNGLELEFH